MKDKRVCPKCGEICFMVDLQYEKGEFILYCYHLDEDTKFVKRCEVPVGDYEVHILKSSPK